MSDNWKWNKPHHWVDIHRAAAMLDKNATKGTTRRLLLQGMANGHVRQIGRGMYQLTRKPLLRLPR